MSFGLTLFFRLLPGLGWLEGGRALFPRMGQVRGGRVRRFSVTPRFGVHLPGAVGTTG
jgi:hypothetical protein